MNNDSFLRVERQKLSKTGLDADSVRQILKNAELRMSFGVARPRRFAGRFAEFHEADLGRAAATHALVKRGSAQAGLCERYLPSAIVLEDRSGACPVGIGPADSLRARRRWSCREDRLSPVAAAQCAADEHAGRSGCWSRSWQPACPVSRWFAQRCRRSWRRET
jgi:hypothetical protein